jgi:hypothetical protein
MRAVTIAYFGIAAVGVIMFAAGCITESVALKVIATPFICGCPLVLLFHDDGY